MRIFFPKFKFNNPKKKNFLILDNQTFYRNNFFSNKNIYDVLFTRYEEFYILPLIKSLVIFFRKKNNLSFLQNYIIEYIKLANPKYIISFTYYDLFFLNLKNFFPKKKLIIFQCTLASYIVLNEQKKKLKILKKKLKNKIVIDYFVLFGKELIKFYKNYINTKFIIGGSIRNNFISKKFNNLKNRNYLVLISHFVHRDDFQKKYYKMINLLNLIKTYCIDNNLKLIIFGRASPKFEKKEIDFYRNIFKNFKFKYYKRGINNHYQNLNKFKFFVSFTSTLGYEFAIRQERVAFIYGALTDNKNAQLRFGYPQNIPLNGPFWTNKSSYIEICRVLDFIIFSKEILWKKLVNKFIKPVVDYDLKNSNLKKIFHIY